MSLTFADVLEEAKANNTEVIPYVDGAVPVGHFAALIPNEDGKIIYLLEGEMKEPAAPVKGYVLMVSDGMGNAEISGYVQNRRGEEKPLGQLAGYRSAGSSRGRKNKPETVESSFFLMAQYK